MRSACSAISAKIKGEKKNSRFHWETILIGYHSYRSARYHHAVVQAELIEVLLPNPVQCKQGAGGYSQGATWVYCPGADPGARIVAFDLASAISQAAQFGLSCHLKRCPWQAQGEH